MARRRGITLRQFLPLVLALSAVAVSVQAC